MEGYGVLDLSNKSIKKIEKSIIPDNIPIRQVISLNLSANCLQRLDNIDLFSELIELNASRNFLLRMFSLQRLQNLVKIDLSNNHLLSIEGIKELKNLKYLNLSSNNIKVLDSKHLQNNVQLEFLDLSNNNIMHITNISFLKALKTLHLHKNQIANLRHCELYLPGNLEILTLAENNITDLNEVSHLVQLCKLREFSIKNNPCVTMTGNNVGFDYRPFVLNWCMSLQAIDGFVVDDLESLKAEWLYSQGKGRRFRVGEHNQLVQYLADSCPMSSRALESENERKLRLVLSKAHQHQQQLTQEQKSGTPLTRGSSRRSLQSVNTIMTRSLDPGSLSRKTSTIASDDSNTATAEQYDEFSEKRMTRSAHWPESTTKQSSFNKMDPVKRCKYPYGNDEPLPTSTTLVPAPDYLISPSIASSLPFYSVAAAHKCPKLMEEDVEPCDEKLKIIKNKASMKQRQLEKKTDPNKAATCIQKMWRGYQTRVLDRRVTNMYQQLQCMRFNQYIKKLSADMDATRLALDKEHQLQVLQMEAINALWKKISSLQVSAECFQANTKVPSPDKVNIKNLVTTCNQLDSQVQKLQNSMQEILRFINSSTNNTVMGTQTEIVAVHTPSDEKLKTQFPYKFSARPSSLPIPKMNSTQMFDDLMTGLVEHPPSEIGKNSIANHK